MPKKPMPKKPSTRGGKRPGAGRKADPARRGRSYSVYLTPAEQAAALRRGATVQAGIRAALAAGS